MLSNSSRRTRRMLAYGLTSACCWFAMAGRLPAQGEVVRAHEEAPADDSSATVFGRVVQAGAKVMGRGAKAPSDKEILDAEPKGNSSTVSRKQALGLLPLDQLTAEQRDRVGEVTRNVSFYRRLPKVSFPVEPEVYKYFLSHPDVAVSVWRAMQISKLQMFQTGKHEYEADAGDGSVGAIEILFSGNDRHLALCEGSFTSPLLKTPIEARSLLLLQTSFITEPDGTVVVTHRGDLFISFPSQTMDVAAKVFSPLTVSLTDRTFTEVSMFVRMMSLAMSRRPDWVEQLTEKMDGVPEMRKKQLMDLTIATHTQAIQRAAQQAVFETDLSSDNDEPRLPRTTRPSVPGRAEVTIPRRLSTRPGGAPTP